eukprot:5311624-Pyramimonas_sp.AAC.1
MSSGKGINQQSFYKAALKFVSDHGLDVDPGSTEKGVYRFRTIISQLGNMKVGTSLVSGGGNFACFSRWSTPRRTVRASMCFHVPLQLYKTHRMTTRSVWGHHLASWCP